MEICKLIFAIWPGVMISMKIIISSWGSLALMCLAPDDGALGHGTTHWLTRFAEYLSYQTPQALRVTDKKPCSCGAYILAREVRVGQET